MATIPVPATEHRLDRRPITLPVADPADPDFAALLAALDRLDDTVDAVADSSPPKACTIWSTATRSGPERTGHRGQRHRARRPGHHHHPTTRHDITHPSGRPPRRRPDLAWPNRCRATAAPALTAWAGPLLPPPTRSTSRPRPSTTAATPRGPRPHCRPVRRRPRFSGLRLAADPGELTARVARRRRSVMGRDDTARPRPAAGSSSPTPHSANHCNSRSAT